MNNNVFFSLFDKIYVLSLRSCEERRLYIRKHFSEVGISAFEIFDALAADDIEVSRVQERGEVATFPPCFRCGSIDCGNESCNNFLLPAQIACFLSYLRLFRHIVQGDADRILIVEDDVVFQAYAQDVLSRLKVEIDFGKIPFGPGKTCFLRLGWALCEDHRDAEREFCISTDVKMSNPCFALTKGYAQALLDRYTGIIHTADVYIHQLAARPGEGYTVKPPIASELSWSTGAFSSTIHPKNVHVQYLRKQGKELAATLEEKRIKQHIKKKYYRSLLITGHPRCGTGYAAGLCRQLGLDVGHERFGADGISSWMFAVDDDQVPYACDALSSSRLALTWRYLVMPVRNLADAAGSVIRESRHAPPSYAFRQAHILKAYGIDMDSCATELEQAIVSIVNWVKIISSQNPHCVFRIEDGHESFRSFLVLNGLIRGRQADCLLDTAPVNADKPYRGMQYPKPVLKLEDWLALPQNVLRDAQSYCLRFGYTLPWEM